MTQSANELRLRLRRLGLTDSAVAAAWPRWWSDDAEASSSARAELRFTLARRLGLDPGSLLADRDEPRFLWHEEARFKHLAGETEQERAGITSFGRAVAMALIDAAPAPAADFLGRGAAELRGELLAARRTIGLLELLTLCWAVGVPVVHLRIFPWQQKRMAAMTAKVGERPAVMLAKDANYPAWIAFYLAHELGHVTLDHIPTDRQIVDLEGEPGTEGMDDEERAADAFALELLTGQPEPVVLPTGPGHTHARALAHAALEQGPTLAIEPGTLALCFGHSTGDWATANAALPHIYGESAPVWQGVNALARRELDFSAAASDAADFLEAVLGRVDDR